MSAKPESSALAPVTGAAVALPVETASVAAATYSKAEVEARYLMALQRPRDWAKATAQILAACQRPRFAEEAKYRVPRGRRRDGTENMIEGLSVRFAEEVVRALGNIMVAAVVVQEDEDRRIVRVTATDLENNVTYPADVVVEKTVERSSSHDREVVGTRRNTAGYTVYRVRATEDEILNKQNSMVSKTLRTAVLRFLPADVQEDALAAVAGTLQGNRDEGALPRLERAFAQFGVTREQVEGYLGHPLAAIQPDEFEHLRGVYEAIREGTVTWAQVVADVPEVRRSQPAPLSSAGYETAGGVEKAASPPPERIDMATKPMPQGPKPPDPYRASRRNRERQGVCEHGVSLTEECAECRAIHGGS